MSYIYDIFVNFQSRLYDFYEWNNTDQIMHIRKIPIFKISSENLLKLKNNKVRLSFDTLNKLSNRTEFFSERGVKNIKYVSLFGDEHEIIALEFDDDGNKYRSSKLLLDEELEVLEVLDNLDYVNVEYKVLEKEDNISFKTRKENKIYDYILKQLTKDNYSKLKYLYFELFGKEEDNFKKIVADIKAELENNWANANKQAYSFFRLSSQRR